MKLKTAYCYIRYSSPRQITGDSVRRQTEYSQRWASENGYRIVKTMIDKGKSGFTAENLASGELGKFVDQVKGGKIPEGTALLVESLDRLSREEVPKALELFLGIINSGVDIVTVGDDMRRYTRVALQMTDLVISIVIMSRGHEESRTKRDRATHAQAVRRQRLRGGEKLSGRHPNWLTWLPELKEFQVVPERAKVIQDIYRMFRAGHTQMGIAMQLNRDRVPTMRAHEKQRGDGRVRQPRTGWDNHSIKFFLTTRTVLGEYQPRGANRIAEGPPIAGYYPRIINDDDFLEVQVLLAKTKGKGGGRRDHVENIFGTIARCQVCRGGMSRAVGSAPWKIVTLRCNNGRRAVTECGHSGVPYDHLERAVLLAVAHRISAADLLGRTQPSEELEGIEKEISRLNIHESALGTSIGNYLADLKSVTTPTLRKKMVHEIDNMAREQTLVQEQLRNLRLEHARLLAASTSIETSLTAAKDLITTIQAAKEPERSDLRRRLSMRLRELLQFVSVNTSARCATVAFHSGGCFHLFALGNRFRLESDEVKPLWQSGAHRYDLLGEKVVLVRYADEILPQHDSPDDKIAAAALQRWDELPLPISRDGRIEGVAYYPIVEPSDEERAHLARLKERWPQVIHDPADWEAPSDFPDDRSESTTVVEIQRETELKTQKNEKKRPKGSSKNTSQTPTRTEKAENPKRRK